MKKLSLFPLLIVLSLLINTIAIAEASANKFRGVSVDHSTELFKVMSDSQRFLKKVGGQKVGMHLLLIISRCANNF